MREINKIAEGLFEKIRDRFEDVSLGDENAHATQKPENARFFNFDYISNGKNYGNVTISIIDETSLKVYFSKAISHELTDEQRKEWYSFLRELREFAKRNLLSFEPRDITRGTLKQRDIQQVSKSDNTFSKDEVVSESRLYGTSRSSYENDGPVRIIIRHSDNINTERRGARSRKIRAIYLENSEGERLKLPHNSLGYARAMARHVAEGGQINDEFGQHITEIAEECSKLKPFKASMMRRVFEDEETQSMVEAAFEYHGLLKDTLSKMSGRKGYQQCKEQFEQTHTSYVTEDDLDVDSLRERFVKRSFNERMNDALPIVYKAYNMKKSNKLANQFESWANNIAESWDAGIEDLLDLLADEIPVGVDAVNAITALENTTLSQNETYDDLVDELIALSEIDPEEDARDTIMGWLQTEMPQEYQKITQNTDDDFDGDQLADYDKNIGENSGNSKFATMSRRDLLEYLGLDPLVAQHISNDKLREKAELKSQDMTEDEELTEGRMKDVAIDIEELSNKQFYAKYKMSKEEVKAKLSESTQLNEYLLKPSMPASEILNLNLFADFTEDDPLSTYYEEFANSPEWMAIEQKYSQIAQALKQKLAAQPHNRILSAAEARALEGTWYDGADKDLREEAELEESVKIVDRDYDLDQQHFKLHVNGKPEHFVHHNYENGHATDSKDDIHDQVKTQLKHLSPQHQKAVTNAVHASYRIKEEKLPAVPKDKESGLPKKYVAGLSADTAKARALEGTWYDGGDAYSSVEDALEFLPEIYDAQVDMIEAFLAGNITDEEFGDDEFDGDQLAEGYDEGSEGADAKTIQSSIIRRILADPKKHSALIRKAGPDGIMNAALDVASFHAPMQEIGSSDISIMIQEVYREVGVEYPVSETHGDYVNKDQSRKKPKKRFYSLKTWQKIASEQNAEIKKKIIDATVDYSFYEALKDGDKIGWFDTFDNTGYLTMPDNIEEHGIDYVNKDEKLKRMGAKPLGMMDKLKTIPQGMKAMATGDTEDDLVTYNKGFVKEDSVDIITKWGIYPEEWAELEEAVDNALANIQSEEDWDGFVHNLNDLDDTLAGAVEEGLGSQDREHFMTAILNALRTGEQRYGTEPRAAVDKLTWTLKKAKPRDHNQLEEMKRLAGLK